MATHSSVLAWRIPGTGEPGGLPSMGSHRVGHDCSDLAAVAAESSNVGKLEKARKHVLLEPSERMQPYPHLDFSPMRLIWTSDLQKSKQFES